MSSRLFAILILAFCLSCRLGKSQDALPLPSHSAALIDSWNEASAINTPSIINWLKETYGKSLGPVKDIRDYFTNPAPSFDYSKSVLATTESVSEAGPHRLLYSDHFGGTIVSLFPSGKIEMVADTSSNKGIIPYLVRKDETNKLVAAPATSCSTCHSKDFTYIWNEQIGHEFSRAVELKEPLKNGVGLLKKFAQPPFVQMLVKRAAKNLFEKVISKHPERFKKHALLLIKLLMECDPSEKEWNELLQEMNKQSPHLVKLWSNVWREWDGYTKEKASEYQNQSYALGPLMLIHYLGVPPQSIFLFHPLTEEDHLFDSMGNFAQLQGKLEDFRKGHEDSVLRRRWGPLGAYGGDNDDVRGYFAAQIAEKVLPRIKYESESSFNSPTDVSSFLEMKPRARSDKFNGSDTTSFRFSIMGIYNHLYADYNPHKSESTTIARLAKEKAIWCKQLTPENADFSFMGTENAVTEKDVETLKSHSAKPTR